MYCKYFIQNESNAIFCFALSHTHTLLQERVVYISILTCFLFFLFYSSLLARLSIFYYKVFSKIKIFCKTTLSSSLPSKHRREDLFSLTFKKGNVILYINHKCHFFSSTQVYAAFLRGGKYQLTLGLEMALRPSGRYSGTYVESLHFW